MFHDAVRGLSGHRVPFSDANPASGFSLQESGLLFYFTTSLGAGACASLLRIRHSSWKSVADDNASGSLKSSVAARVPPSLTRAR